MVARLLLHQDLVAYCPDSIVHIFFS